MSKQEQADHIWKHLFVERTPIGEACRGVLTTLERLGLDPNEKSLKPYRKWFAKQDPDKYIDKVMKIANVDLITMTNPVFDDHERGLWEKVPGIGQDPRFAAVLRIDPLLRNWSVACGKLWTWGYQARPDFSGRTVDEVRRFLAHWLDKMKAVYVAMSLPPEFRYPDPNNPAGDRFIREILMPVLAERGRPWAMMIGARLRVNPGLQDGGDSGRHRRCHVGRESLPGLPAEQIHGHDARPREPARAGRLGAEVREPAPLRLLVVPQQPVAGRGDHPDAAGAFGDDVRPAALRRPHPGSTVYKWEHSRRVIAKVLVDKYVDLEQSGFKVTAKHIRADVALLLRDNYRSSSRARARRPAGLSAFGPTGSALTLLPGLRHAPLAFAGFPGPAPGAENAGGVKWSDHAIAQARWGMRPIHGTPPPRHPHTNPTDVPNPLGARRRPCGG